jgi:hypothetical protein
MADPAFCPTGSLGWDNDVLFKISLVWEGSSVVKACMCEVLGLIPSTIEKTKILLWKTCSLMSYYP